MAPAIRRIVALDDAAPVQVLLVASAFSEATTRARHRQDGGDASGCGESCAKPPVLAFFLAAFMEQLSRFPARTTFFSVCAGPSRLPYLRPGLLLDIGGVVFEVGVFFTIGRFFRRYDASWMLLIALVHFLPALGRDRIVPGEPAGNAAGADRARAWALRVLCGGDADAGDLLPGRLNGHGQRLLYGSRRVSAGCWARLLPASCGDRRWPHRIPGG